MPVAFQTTRSADSHLAEFEIVASQFKFEPARIEVTQGDHVRIVVHSIDKNHGFGIKKLKIDKPIPATGKPVAIEFDAKEIGEFEIACSESCGAGHKDMKGSLVVAARASDASSRDKRTGP